MWVAFFSFGERRGQRRDRRREDNPKRLIKWGQPTAPETKGIVCIPPPSPRIVIVDEASRIYLASSGVIL